MFDNAIKPHPEANGAPINAAGDRPITTVINIGESKSSYATKALHTMCIKIEAVLRG